MLAEQHPLTMLILLGPLDDDAQSLRRKQAHSDRVSKNGLITPWSLAETIILLEFHLTFVSLLMLSMLESVFYHLLKLKKMNQLTDFHFNLLFFIHMLIPIRSDGIVLWWFESVWLEIWDHEVRKFIPFELQASWAILDHDFSTIQE